MRGAGTGDEYSPDEQIGFFHRLCNRVRAGHQRPDLSPEHIVQIAHSLRAPLQHNDVRTHAKRDFQHSFRLYRRLL